MFYGKLLELLPDFFLLGCQCFWTPATHHTALGNQKSLLFRLHWANCVSWRLFGKKIFNSSNFSVSVQFGPCCCEWLQQLGFSVFVLVEISKNKSWFHSILCLQCGVTVNSSSALSFNCLRTSQGKNTMVFFSLNPVTMSDVSSGSKLYKMTQRDIYYTMRTILWTVRICFLVFCIEIPGCLQNGSGMHPNLWVQMKLVYLRESTQKCLPVLLVFWDISLSLFLQSPLTPEWYIPFRWSWQTFSPVNGYCLNLPRDSLCSRLLAFSCFSEKPFERNISQIALETEPTPMFDFNWGRKVKVAENTELVVINVMKIITVLSLDTFVSPLFTFSSKRIIIVCTLSESTRKGNTMNTSEWTYQLWRERNTFPSTSSIIRRLLFHLSAKMYRLIPSEMSIKLLILCSNYSSQMKIIC